MEGSDAARCTHHTCQLEVPIPDFVPYTHGDLYNCQRAQSPLTSAEMTHILQYLDLSQQPIQPLVILPFYVMRRPRISSIGAHTSSKR